MIAEKISVLDHGYVRLIETWGSEERIVEAARMSTGKGFRGWGPVCRTCGYPQDADDHEVGCDADPGAEASWSPGDEKLLRFLWEKKHHTPFEMAGATFEIQAPIFVFREWHRHRTQSYNELSARYTPLPNMNYLPTTDRVMSGIASAGANKQAQGSGRVPTSDELSTWLARLDAYYAVGQALYEEGLSIGIPKEIARCPVTVSRYSRMRASANLRNWFGFLMLRDAPDAQWEIRQFAGAVRSLLVDPFPRTSALFSETAAKR